jgi:hypothetical protein
MGNIQGFGEALVEPTQSEMRGKPRSLHNQPLWERFGHEVFQPMSNISLCLPKGDKEFDLQVDLCLKSELLEELAPCLHEKHNRDPSMWSAHVLTK